MKRISSASPSTLRHAGRGRARGNSGFAGALMALTIAGLFLGGLEGSNARGLLLAVSPLAAALGVWVYRLIKFIRDVNHDYRSHTGRGPWGPSTRRAR